MRVLHSQKLTVVTALLSHVIAVTVVPPPSLNLEETDSIQGVAKTLAEGVLSYYPGSATAFSELPDPYYWWECGALMGALLDYSHYTNDSTYNDLLTTGLAAQLEPPYDLIVQKHRGDEGNDDQAFWTFAILSAAERNFPQVANKSIPSWLQVAENTFNNMIGRWNMSACGGGLLWQIYPENPNGLDYRNSVSNGGLFQISARLYRATGNETYLHWANKVWDWTVAIKMIGDDYVVYDGAESSDNCTKMNPVSFSYAAGIYLYGAAVLANSTDGDASSAWVEHTEGLLKAAESFFSPFANATNIMYEHACEQVDRCNTDMKSFKGYLSRFMYASAIMAPAIQPTVQKLLDTSAMAAANACSGGANSTTCGQKWYVGGFDGNVGLGQEMCALETIQGLLAQQAPPPLAKGEIKDVREPAAKSSSSTTKGGASSPTSASTTAVKTSAVASSAAMTLATASPAHTKRSRSAGVALKVPGIW
ncbi:Mannan endo-1,6-alpha-mannosidase DCW1 [Cytospora mali]|uniref:Mannan endo-1,6-alpha-mannosidase n=1 Tax=Cytospora mali TaxID=578113 RepID=A0A194VIE1_CYTMA|nr:Mannan endo-1,6-alpha-mannosidase DCW1 [Valsa mali]